MYDLIRSKTDCMHNDVVRFTQRLVQTRSPSLNEEDAAQVVEKEMRNVGYDHVFCDEFGNVVGLLPGRENFPIVLLACHLDNVVPAVGNPSENPQDGTLIAENLYGTGASDCKAGLAAQIYAGALLRQILLPLRGSLVVAATVAEENGSSIGLKGLIEQTLPVIGWKPDIAILGEPTDLGVYYGHDGWMDVDVCISGASSYDVGSAGQAIFEDFAETSDVMRSTPHREELNVKSPLFKRHEGGWQSTLRLTRRLHSNEGTEALVGELQEQALRTAALFQGITVNSLIVEETQKLWNGRDASTKYISRPWKSDSTHPLLRRAFSALAASGTDVRPGRWDLARLRMGTSGGALAHDFGIPTIGYGPGLEDQAHRAGEWVNVKNIVRAVYGTASMLNGLIGMPNYGWSATDI